MQLPSRKDSIEISVGVIFQAQLSGSFQSAQKELLNTSVFIVWWRSHCLSPISGRSDRMKLTYPICCGVDVHKTFLIATIITSDYVMPHYHQKRLRILRTICWIQTS